MKGGESKKANEKILILIGHYGSKLLCNTRYVFVSFISGKSIPIFRGHAHLTGYLDASDHNFSHRIDQFSFGEQSHAGIVQPLQGDEKIADKNFMSYQYFVQIVPTEVSNFKTNYQKG